MRAVRHGVFRISDRESVGTHAAGAGVGDGKFRLRIEVRLLFAQLLAEDEARVGNAVAVFAHETVDRHERQRPVPQEVDVLPHAVERYVQLLADLIVHGVAAPDVFVLERAAAEVDAGVHLAVVPAGGAEREVGLLLHEQNVELPARQLARDGHARNAAADDEHIRRFALQRIVAQRRHTHGRDRRPGEGDVVYHVAAGGFRRGHLAGADHVVPRIQRAAQHNAVVLQRGVYAPAEGLIQFSVACGDVHVSSLETKSAN